MKTTSEKDLIENARTGNVAAFEELVRLYQPRIRELVFRYTQDANIVRDLTQEIFFKAYRHITDFEGRSQFYTWLYSISINSIRNHHKSQSRRPTEINVDMFRVENVLDHLKLREKNSPESELEVDDFEDQIYTAIDSLPEPLGLTFMLREVIGLAYDDIALITKCPIGTVRSRLARARLMLDGNSQG